MSSHEQLMGMGFSKEAVEQALVMNNNNFDNALSLLLNQATMVDNVSNPPQPIGQPIAQAFPIASSSSSSSSSLNPMLDSLAQALSSDRSALDAINGILVKLINNPTDQTVTVLQLGGSLAPIKNNDIAIQFLKELGYSFRSGFLMLNSSPQYLSEGKQAIMQAMSNQEYHVSTLLESTKISAIEDARNQRQILREKPIRKEPIEGSGVAFTRLVFHGLNLTTQQMIERKFEPDECLSDVIHYLGTLDISVLDGCGWELIETAGGYGSSGSQPYWWCNDWILSDVTLRPARDLNKEDANKTLQSLGLWPSAQINIKVIGITAKIPTSVKTTQSTATQAAQAQALKQPVKEQYVGSRPTPAQMMKSATNRFESAGPLNGKGKEHANVNRSAASSSRAAAAEARMHATSTNSNSVSSTSGGSKPSVATSGITSETSTKPPTASSTSSVAGGDSTTVSELMAMGFPEAQVRSALATCGGDQARAVEILLR